MATENYVFEAFKTIDKYLYDSSYNSTTILNQKIVVRRTNMDPVMTITFDENAISKECVNATGPALEEELKNVDAKTVVGILAQLAQ